ncbi:MAG: HD domain-containing protein [Candidatus Altiarchaeota archaeon]
MVYAKKQPVDSLRDGDRVEDVFAVKVKRGFSQYAKGYTFQLLFTDSSGRTIEYKYWGGQDEGKVRRLYDSIPADGIVYVQGKASTYMEKLQVSTNEPDTIRPLKEGEYNPDDFIMPAKKDLDTMWRELEGHISRVKSQEVKSVLERVFQDVKVKEKFRRHPGAIEIHHNWTGGLLQHTLEVAEYSLLSWKLFPDMDQDLLIAGSLLHDIGKLEELTVTTRIKGTRKGQLKGHIALGYGRVSKAMDELKTGEDVRDKLLHMIISHHGSMEYGSPKPPMIPEAFAVNYADVLSSKLSEITEYVKWAKDNTDDEFMYHKRHGHNILLD